MKEDHEDLKSKTSEPKPRLSRVEHQDLIDRARNLLAAVDGYCEMYGNPTSNAYDVMRRRAAELWQLLTRIGELPAGRNSSSCSTKSPPPSSGGEPITETPTTSTKQPGASDEPARTPAASSRGLDTASLIAFLQKLPPEMRIVDLLVTVDAIHSGTNLEAD